MNKIIYSGQSVSIGEIDGSDWELLFPQDGEDIVAHAAAIADSRVTQRLSTGTEQYRVIVDGRHVATVGGESRWN